MKFKPDIFDNVLNSFRRFYDKMEAKGAVWSKSSTGWIIVVSFCFLIIFILNVLTPLSADDFGYLYIHAENVRVSSLSDVFHSQVNHYYLWGGRSVVHFIAQSILLLPNIAIDLLNSLVYLAFIFLIYFHIIGRGKHSLSLFVLINLAVWIIQPAYGDTILWTTGSANYLWGTAIVLALLLPFRFYTGKSDSGLYVGLFKCIGMFVGGVLAGWTNENTAAAMLVIIILFFFYYKSNGWKIPVWGILGILGSIIGYSIMIMAPGNIVRAGDAVIVSAFLILYRLFNYTLTLFSSYGALTIFYLLFLILSWHFRKSSKSGILKVSLIYFVAFLAAIYAMLFSPSFPSRAWFGPLTFFIIAIGIVFYNLNCQYKFIRQIKAGILMIAIIMFFFSFYEGVRDIYSFYRISQQREIEVEEAKNQGMGSYEFERFSAKTKFTHTEEPRSNFMMKGYYGIDIYFKEE